MTRTRTRTRTRTTITITTTTTTLTIIIIIIKFLRNTKLHTKYKAQCAYLIAKIRNSNCINISMEYIYQTLIENDRKHILQKVNCF